MCRVINKGRFFGGGREGDKKSEGIDESGVLWGSRAEDDVFPKYRSQAKKTKNYGNVRRGRVDKKGSTVGNNSGGATVSSARIMLRA